MDLTSFFFFFYYVPGNRSQTKENKRNDVTIDSDNGCNLSANKKEISENNEGVARLSISLGSECQTAAIARLTVACDSGTEDNYSVFNDNKSRPVSSSTNNKIGGAAVAVTSSAVPMCNGHGHTARFSRDLGAEFLCHAVDNGEYVESNCNKDSASTSDNVCMNNAVRGAGESLLCDIEQCELGSSQLVKCVSLDSCDGEGDDMQTETILDDCECFFFTQLLHAMCCVFLYFDM